MNTIVVGVDGSEESIDALRFAIDEARSRGAGVDAVGAWHVPLITYSGTPAYVPPPIDPGQFEKAAAATLEHALEAVAGESAGVEVTPVVREGQPAEVLVDAAKGAELLVVGSRGRGGFAGLLLGSVSQQCVHHAACPVVVVPHRNGRE